MKTIHIDYGYLLKIYNEFKAGVVKEQKSIQKEIAEMLAKEICEDLKNAYEKIINDWYSSYSPMFYNRKNTLEKAAKITSNGSVITIDINSDPLGGHRLENDKLYN